MGNEDQHGERIVATEVEIRNIKERLGKIEKGIWALLATVGGYIVTQLMQIMQGGPRP